MELPLFNEQQAGATYYLSPMTVNNLGMVDQAHKYPDRKVSEHMHCHVYTDAVGKKKQCGVPHNENIERLESSSH